MNIYSLKTKNIIIQFFQPINEFKIFIAPLKYNKKFAYSLTFDDSLLSSYKVAFPLLNGGKISGSFINDLGFDDGGDNSFSNGLYYTDGCGNDINFTAGIAITSAYEDGKDIHLGNNNTYLTWDNIIEMYKNGWNVLNHSYSHSVGEGTDYKNEIIKNTETVLKKTGILMNQFVTPSGDLNYYNYVFDYGILGLYSGALEGTGFVYADEDLNLEKFKLKRILLKSPDLNKKNIMNNLDSLIKSNKKPFWYNEFTHSCGNYNMWNIGIHIDTFKFYMNYIYSKYGKSGSDNIWFAPLQDVYEYLFLKKKIKIKAEKIDSNKVIIIFNDDEIRKFNIDKKELSLIVDTKNKIKNIKSKSVKIKSYTDKLINLRL